MLPLCCEDKIGVLPWSPLGSGRLAREGSAESTHRAETDAIAKAMLHPQTPALCNHQPVSQE